MKTLLVIDTIILTGILVWMLARMVKDTYSQVRAKMRAKARKKAIDKSIADERKSVQRAHYQVSLLENGEQKEINVSFDTLQWILWEMELGTVQVLSVTDTDKGGK